MNALMRPGIAPCAAGKKRVKIADTIQCRLRA